jgi:phage replication O-like protein O
MNRCTVLSILKHVARNRHHNLFTRHQIVFKSFWSRGGFACALSGSWVPKGMRAAIRMASSESDRFVRVPSTLLDVLLTVPLNGTQGRIILWVIRNTAGWNRDLTTFSWYRIAKKIGGDRAVVWRAGQRLLQAQILFLEGRQLGIQKDKSQWRVPGLAHGSDAARQLGLSGDVAMEQRHPLPASNAPAAAGQRIRDAEATVLRRAKDSGKDKSKININTRMANGVTGQLFRNGAISKQQHPAGAARPIPGKYERISQD